MHCSWNLRAFCRINVKANLMRNVCAFHSSVLGTKAKEVDDHGLEEENILLELNSHSEESLSKFKHIGKEKAERLLSYRRQHGEFKSFDELENVSGFTPSIIRSIQTQGFVERKKRSHAHVLTPSQANKIESLTVINIGRVEIVWCSLSRELKMLDWRSVEFKREKQYKPKMFIENVKSILGQIPKTDIYVVELQNHKSASTNPSVFPLTLHSRLTEAVIHAVSNIPTFSFDPNVVKRHFSLPKAMNKQYYSMTVVNDLLADTRKRSSSYKENESDEINIDEEHCLQGGTELVQSILSKNVEDKASKFTKPNHLHSFQAPEHFIDFFNEKKYKDCLSDSLLQALAFLELEILDRI